MKKLILTASFLLISAFAFATEDVTGLQWLEMSAGNKMDRIRMSMAVLGVHGVGLKHTANDYYNDVSQKLRFQPSLFNDELTEILALVASEKEPSTKTALEKYRHTV